MQLVFGRDEEVCKWVCEKVDCTISPPFVAIGAKKDGKLIGGAVFNEYNGANIHITLASDGALARGTIAGIYDYCFNQSKVGRVTAMTKRSNKQMRDLLPRLGFKFEAVLSRYYGPKRGDDAFTYALFPENAKDYLK